MTHLIVLSDPSNNFNIFNKKNILEIIIVLFSRKFPLSPCALYSVILTYQIVPVVQLLSSQ